MATKAPIAATTMAMPMSDATSSPWALRPAMVSRARAMIGNDSLAKTFQTPDTSTDRVIDAVSKPQDSPWAKVAPMPTAPPKGTALAMADPDRFITAAWGRRSPGRAWVSMAHTVTMFTSHSPDSVTTATASSSSSSARTVP